MANDQIRASDADREQVAARLRDHFAEGRLTREELDERIAATLNAKTIGDLRPPMADLPGPAPVQASPGLARPAPPGWPRPPMAWRGLRILPLLAIGLAVALTLNGGAWAIFGFFRFLLIFWLVTTAVGLIMGRRMRRWRGGPWRGGQGPGYGPPRSRGGRHYL
jgi:hypothetical protein